MSPERVGLSPVNRAGVGVDAEGVAWLCYAGREKNLSLLSSAPGLEWKREWGCLALPITRENLLLLETIGGLDETSEEYVHARGRSLSICTQNAEKYPHPPLGEPPPLRHQVEAFLLADEVFERGRRGFGQWSQMGTGKSRWAIDLMRSFVEKSALVIVQNSTALQWVDNLQRGWPEAEVVLLTGVCIAQRKRHIQGLMARRERWPHVAVVNWEALGPLRESLCKVGFDMVVGDEATRAKDRNTIMSKAAFAIAKTCQYRVAMSGTPLGNSPEDLWAIYRFMDETIFGTRYWDFVERYFKLGGFTGRQFTGFIPERLPEFIAKMYSCAYRITKSCVMDMPEKNYEVVKLPLEGEQKRIYEQVVKDMWASRVDEEGRERTLSVANALVLVTRLQQVTAGLFPSNEGEVWCDPIPSVKTEWIANYAAEAGEEQLVIWCRFTQEISQMAAALLKRGLNVGIIAGNIPMKEREALRLEFNDRENPLRVLVCQTQAAAYGLDLPNADTLVFATNSFSYLERAQAEDRGHRMGRVRPYKILDIALRNSIDIQVLAALKEKSDLASLVLTKGFLGARTFTEVDH